MIKNSPNSILSSPYNMGSLKNWVLFHLPQSICHRLLSCIKKKVWMTLVLLFSGGPLNMKVKEEFIMVV